MEHSFERDRNSSALLNKDRQGLENYRSKREKIKEDLAFKTNIANEINDLKGQMNMIIELLQAGNKT